MLVYPDLIEIEVNEDETICYFVNGLEYVDFISIMGPLKEELIDLLVCIGDSNDQPN